MRRTNTQIIYHLPGLFSLPFSRPIFPLFGLLAFVQLSQATNATVTLYYLFSDFFW